MTEVNTLPDIADGFSTPQPRLLLVASTGGHLEQLTRIARASGISAESEWVSFNSPQTSSLLENKRVTLVRYISQRDWGGALAILPIFFRLLRRGKFDGLVSTGAAIAGPAFLAARILGVPTLYIESVSRTDGPSLTGRILRSTKLATNLWTQHEAWADTAWKFHGSVLSDYHGTEKESPTLVNVFVTLGTLKDYRFDTLVEGVAGLDLDNVNFTWQTGCTDGLDLPGTQYPYLPADEFDRVAQASDVVITHAGVGSVLRLLSLGIYPLLVPRRASRGEHIDDHQEQIARTMAKRGLAAVAEADDITVDLLCQVSTRAVTRVD